MGNKSNNTEAIGGCAILIVIFIVFSLLADSGSFSGYNQDLYDLEGAHSHGARVGAEDGLKVGSAKRLDHAKQEGYRNTVDEAKSSKDYFLMPHYCAAIAVVAFAIGYFGQFSIFYVLRRIGILADIDLILLPRSSRVVQLRVNE